MTIIVKIGRRMATPLNPPPVVSPVVSTVGTSRGPVIVLTSLSPD
jgi:hypothetical protein